MGASVKEVPLLKKFIVNRARIADIGAKFELDKNSKLTHLIHKILRD